MVIGVVAIAVAAYVVLLWRGAAWLYGSGLHALSPAEQEKALDDVRARLIQLAAGLLATAALIYTGLNFRLSREGHVTDRFTKAIEQLGSDRLDVRLGAIYALERIMTDSERDHSAIVEILAAYVRGHAPRQLQDPTGGGSEEAKSLTRPDAGLATDAQAALSVLGRRPKGREERGVDLKDTNLRGAYLVGADLSIAVLTNADLTGADLRWINLYSASMAGANLSGAHLQNAILNGADLRVNLSGADLRGADLRDAAIPGTNFRGAEMRGVLIETACGLKRGQLDEALTDADIRLPTYMATDATQANKDDGKTSDPDPSPPS